MGAIRFAGRACRLPMADSVDEFADLLFSGTCAISEIPDARWRKEPFLHPVPGTRGKSYTFAAGVLRRAEAFDAAPFGISPREAEYMDPQQRLMLQVVWEALEDACIVPADLAGQNVGVYMGASMMDHAGNLTSDPALADSYMMTGSSLAVIANRVSHAFDLHGPSLTIDTACSSSLFALEAAASALARGEIDTAIVGATNMLMTPAFFVGFSEARMLSPSGLCQAFSDRADGYVRGEGAVAFVLRRQDPGAPPLPRDHGRLVHVGVNTTGRSVNIALPSAAAQFALLDKIYRDAGIRPDQLAFVEAHGTGTPVGDPIEAQALGRALGRWRSAPLPIGSVKSNIGHLEPAAGCAGLLKALIALERRRLPPSLNAGPPNAAIPFSDLNLAVAEAPIELDLDDPRSRYAGVSAFGFGGANAHAILEASDPAGRVVGADDAPDGERMFFTSAFCREALRASAATYRDRLFDDDGRPATSLLDALVHFRGAHPHRVAVLATDGEETRQAIDSACRGEAHPALIAGRSGLTGQPPVFLFSGNGSQYPGMSQAALQHDRLFRERYEDVDACWRTIAGWSLLDMVRDPDLGGRIRAAEIAQPLLFADQLSMVAALEARGVRPAAVLGHSGGEVAAAAATGALTLAEALGVLFARATAQAMQAGQGAMAAVQASEAEVETALAGGEFGAVAVSAVNSPRSVSISGPIADLERFQRHARRELRWACIRLKVDYAFHHAMQDETEETFRTLLSALAPAPGRVPFISSVTGITEPGARLDGDYWWCNVRRSVRFLDAVSTAAARGFRYFLEIGPDPVLGAYARDTLRDLPEETAVTHAAARTDGAGLNPVRLAVARTLVHGGRIDLARLAPRPGYAPGGLASYPWQMQDLRVHKRSRKVTELAATDARFHPLLGRPVGADANVWMREFDRHLVPELADHAIAGKPIMPATGFGDMALAAAQRALDADLVELRDLDFVAPLPFHAKLISEVRTSVAGPRNEIRIASRARFSDDPWLDHVRGRAQALLPANPGADDAAPDIGTMPGDLDGARLYDSGPLIGLDYGPEFRRVARYRIVDERTIEVVLRPDPPAALSGRSVLDVIGADAVLHGLLGLPGTGRFADAGLGFLPVRVGRLALLGPGAQVRSGRLRVHRIGDRSMHADIALFDIDGRAIARLEGIRLRAVRLIQQIDTMRHVFATEPVALDLPGPVDLPLPGDIARALHEAASGDADDEALLLLNALAHRIAHDGLSAMRGPDGVAGLPMPGGDAATRLAATLAAMLEASGLAERVPSGLRPAVATDLPPADVLIRGLLAERPDLGAECTLMARLADALPELLAGTIDTNPEAVFGRAAWSAATGASPLRRRDAERVAAILAPAFAAMPAHRPVRIAEVVDSAPVILDLLTAGCRAPVYRFAVGAGTVPILARSTLAAPVGSGNSIRALDSAEVEAHGPFDLIVACPSVLGGAGTNAVLEALTPHLRDGGLLVAMRPGRQDWIDLIRAAAGIDPMHHASLPASGDPDRSDDDTFRRLEPADGEPGTALVARMRRVATPAAVPEQLASNASVPAVDAPVLVRRLLDGLAGAMPAFAGAATLAHHAAADLWVLGAYRPGGRGGAADPVIFIAPDHPPTQAGDAVLKQRLLVLARLIHAAPGLAKPIWLVAPGATAPAGPATPGQAALWAALRTAKNEYPVLDLRAADPGALELEAAAEMLVGPISGQGDETEIVLTPNGPSALRVRIGAATPEAAMADGQAAARLVDDATSGLDTLSWRRTPRPRPGPGQVLVEVAATGLNYRDVMWAMGLLPEEALEGGMAGATLGLECAGRVVAAGDDDGEVQPGDDVVVIGPSSFSTHVVADRDWVLKLPTGLSPEAGASIPVAFFTAWYALDHLARLASGETVLIHGGAGGVGLAAIQVARDRGARIIATAGSAAKRSLLARVGADHVLNSRGPAFEAEVRNLTRGEGVDVVLNALSGGSMERSLTLLRPFGRFVELGKQDFYSDTPVGLRALKDNIGYFSADLDGLLAQRPDLARSLYRQMLELFAEGRLGPIPYRVFAGRDAGEAFRTMQRSAHVGKIVVRPPDPETVRTPECPAIFRATDTGTLVIFGGGGGLGLALAEQQMIRGAAAIALVGRSAAPPAAAAEMMARAAARGTEMTYESCDIADRVALERTLGALRRRRAITDVVNSAMVLEDMRLADLTPAVLDRTMAAKVAGTRNLDQATRGDPIRTFTVFTSLATLIGNHGQAAYVAANAYMEGIVRQRRAEGLPGLALGWGAIADAGYLTRNPDRARLLRRMGGNIDFTVRQAVRAFELLAGESGQRGGDAVLWVSPMQWQATIKGLRLLQGPTYRALRDLGERTEDETETDDLRERILSLSPEDARARLTGFLCAEIARILRVQEAAIQTNRPVSDAGVDSLMGVELGLAAQQALGDDVPLMAISSAHSIEEIAEKIVEHIHGVGMADAGSDTALGDLVAQHVGPAAGARMTEPHPEAAE